MEGRDSPAVYCGARPFGNATEECVEDFSKEQASVDEQRLRVRR
jgi:hypothetical protein